jgi:hypothetical protein
MLPVQFCGNSLNSNFTFFKFHIKISMSEEGAKTPTSIGMEIAIEEALF